jgi:acyl carrier protein
LTRPRKKVNPESRTGSRSSIKKEVRRFILENFLTGDEAGSLDDNDLLFEGGIIDSGGALTFISYLEERFKISVLDEELFPSNFASVNKIVDYILSKLVQRSAFGDLDRERA